MDLDSISEISRPESRGDLGEWREGDAWLAGGTWLFSEPQPHLSRLVDLASFGWPPLEISDGGLTIAATCTLAQLAAADLPPAWRASSLFRLCCRALLGSFKIWNSATVGGNLCMALPAGPMAALAVALDGICEIWTPGGAERRLRAVDFITGPQQNALRTGELLRAVFLPDETLRRRTAFRQISLTPQGRSAALLVGTLSQTGSFSLTVTAATRQPIHLDFQTVPSGSDLNAALIEAIPDAQYYDDLHGPPFWRRKMTFRLAEQILRELDGTVSE